MKVTKYNLRKIKLLVNVLEKGIIRFKEVTERAFPVAQLVKNPPAMQETPVWFLGQEDLLEKG